MAQGPPARLQQVGTPVEIYETPATPEVAGFIGRCNLLDGRIDEESPTDAKTQLAIGDLRVHAESAVRHTGPEISLVIRPEDCLLYPRTT
ncbi:hypothetical protein [Streptomyces sp. Rer75]|uniref:hypothetical protein n=1 Tax=unclassified Streptomyces TaxID=2593676 RepID=UPI0015CF956D|nr:hypothetical protein [Streptomyces sp. Rer75]QLH19253.1 hypothetical protein HYQ63_06255 [Streptomyces sp. Rer75]